MKRTLLLILTSICLQAPKAQYVNSTNIPLGKFTVLDSAQLKFTYNFKYKKGIMRNATDTAFVNDKQTLLIGKKKSKYFSQYYFDKCERIMKKEPFKVPEESECSFEIFKNYPSGKITVTEQAGAFSLGGNYKYTEDTPSIQWKIESDTTTILSYSCQKATCTFRGRNYTAWFAPEIPSNNGPWKFGGLPGLILKIADDSHAYNFECIGVKQLEKPEPIKFYDLKYITLNRKEMDKIYRRFFKGPIQFWIDVRSEMRGQVTAADLPPMHYNPIELK